MPAWGSCGIQHASSRFLLNPRHGALKLKDISFVGQSINFKNLKTTLKHAWNSSMLKYKNGKLKKAN